MSDVMQITLMGMSEFSEQEYEETIPVIENFIYKGLNSLSAPPKMGKGWLAQQMAHAVSTGEQFFGQPTTKGRVLFVPLEEDPGMLQERMNMIGNMNENVFIMPNRKELLSQFKTREDMLEAIADICKEYEISLCIMDPLVRLSNMDSRNDTTSDGNAFQQERKIYDFMSDLFEDIGCALLLIHHTNKSGLYSGSTALPSVGSGHGVISGEQDNAQLDWACRYGKDGVSCNMAAVRDEKGLHWETSDAKANLELVDLFEVISDDIENAKTAQEMVDTKVVPYSTSKLTPKLKKLEKIEAIERVKEGRSVKFVKIDGMTGIMVKKLLT